MATEERLTVAPIVGPDDPRRFTDSGIEVKPLYTEDDLPERPATLGEPGDVPVHARRAPRDVPQAAVDDAPVRGLRDAPRSPTSATATCSRTARPGLSMAFDLPTQLGLDSDNPRCLGEVGRTGVAIDTIDDMRTAFDGIPLDQVSTSMTINAPAAVLLLLYELVGEEQGVPSEQLRGTTQNDVLKEYIARGNYIYPPRADDAADDRPVRLLPRARPEVEHDLDLRLPLPREGLLGGPGGRASRCAAASPTCRRRSTPASTSTTSPRAWPSSSTATTTSSRRSRSSAPRGGCGRTIMRDRFGAHGPERSLMLRFHTQTGGVTLTAQQPENNIVRVALQGFAAVCGGTQSLHTNGFDEALALPTERAAKIALRTQQIIAHESGATDTVDPFAGSYFVEALTDEIEARAQRADRQGRRARRLGQRDRVHHRRDRRVGLGLPGALPHRARTSSSASTATSRTSVEVPDLLRVDPESEREQVERLKAFKADRDQELVEQPPRGAARGRARHRQPAARRSSEALRDRASMGEVCGAMRDVFGVPPDSTGSANGRRATGNCCVLNGRAARPRSMGEVCGAMRDVFGEYQPQRLAHAPGEPRAPVPRASAPSRGRRRPGASARPCAALLLTRRRQPPRPWRSALRRRRQTPCSARREQFDISPPGRASPGTRQHRRLFR